MIGRFVWRQGTMPTLDGIPIRAQALTLEADDRAATITVTTRIDVEHIEIPAARVRVEREIRATLIALGWTPPPDED